MQNTQLYPVVEIDGTWYSTNNVTVDGNYCKPILMNIPSIKESVDIESRKFKISNVSLQFNNFPFEGVRFSDQLSETSLINKEATIYFKSQSELKEVYKGIIRRLSHDDEKVKVELEDLTEQKAHKDLPLADTYIQTESVPDKYKNKPTPIVYGEVDRSPVALDVDSEGDIILVADSKDISGFNEDSPLYIHKSDTFLNAPMDAISPKTGEPMFRWIKDPDDSDEYITRYNTGVQYSFIGNTITLNGSVSDAEGEQEEGNETGNAIGDNKIVVSQIAYPNVINAIRKKIDNRTGYYSVKHDYDTVTYFPQSGDYSVGDEVEHSNLPLIIRGIVFRENINTPYDGWQQQVDSQDIVGEAMWETTNDLDADGNIFQEGKCGCIIKLPIIEGIGKQDDDIKLSESLGYVYADISAGFWDRELFGNSQDIDIDFRIGGHKYQDHYGTVGMKNYDAQASAADEAANPANTGIAGEFNTDFDYSATSGAFNGLNNQGETYNSITGSDDTVVVWKSSSLLMYTRFHPNTDGQAWNSGICFMQMQIKDLYVNQLDLVDNLLSQSFYANVKGRLAPEFAVIGQDVLLQNPIDIIRDIVVSELGLSLAQIDLVSYAEAKDAHDGWQFAFTVNKKISSKKLIEDIAKSTKCFPKFKNDGSFGFNTVKDSYTLNGDYANATPIKESEVISYSFKKTKPEQIYRKVTVSYNKDYAQDSYLKTAFSEDLGDDPYYGIEDSADAHLEFESDYIRHNSSDGAEQTADELASFLLEQYKNDHLIFNLKLPLQYIDLEIGDLVKFEKLFQGVKAYGIDYTKLFPVNLQTRYPLFMVTSTTKNLDSVSIECMQLHALGNVDNSDWDDFEIEPQDTTAPVITFGSASLTYTVGDAFVPFTATAVDDTDGDITDRITVSYSNDIPINAEASGTYDVPNSSFIVGFSVSDDAGNEAQEVIFVEVSAAPEEEGEFFSFTGFVVQTTQSWVRIGVPASIETGSLENIIPESPYYKINVSSQGQPLTYVPLDQYNIDDPFVEVTHFYFGTDSETPNVFILYHKQINTLGNLTSNSGYWQFENGDLLSADDIIDVELETYDPAIGGYISGSGDANQDGGLNILDVVIMINFILSPQVDPTGELTDIMDINDDSIVNILDIVQLVNLILD